MNQREHAATGAWKSHSERILSRLQLTKGIWVRVTDLVDAGGSYLAVRARIADLRKRGHRIDAKQERTPGSRKVWSYYRLALDTTPE